MEDKPDTSSTGDPPVEKSGWSQYSTAFLRNIVSGEGYTDEDINGLSRNNLIRLICSNIGEPDSNGAQLVVRNYLKQEHGTSGLGSSVEKNSTNQSDADQQQIVELQFIMLEQQASTRIFLLEQQRATIAELKSTVEKLRHGHSNNGSACARPLPDIPWDERNPELFFVKFEKAMQLRYFPYDKWAFYLLEAINGKADNIVPAIIRSHINDYNKAKETIIETLGYNEARHCYEYHNLKLKDDESYTTFGYKLRYHFVSWVGPPSQAAYEKIMIRRFVDVLSDNNIRRAVYYGKPEKLHEAVNIANRERQLIESYKPTEDAKERGSAHNQGFHPRRFRTKFKHKRFNKRIK